MITEDDYTVLQPKASFTGTHGFQTDADHLVTAQKNGGFYTTSIKLRYKNEKGDFADTGDKLDFPMECEADPLLSIEVHLDVYRTYAPGDLVKATVTLTNLNDLTLYFSEDGGYADCRRPDNGYPAVIGPRATETCTFSMILTAGEAAGAYGGFISYLFNPKYKSVTGEAGSRQSVYVTARLKIPVSKDSPSPTSVLLDAELKDPGPFTAGETAVVILRLKNACAETLTLDAANVMPDKMWPADLAPMKEEILEVSYPITQKMLDTIHSDPKRLTYNYWVLYRDADGKGTGANTSISIPLAAEPEPEPEEEPILSLTGALEGPGPFKKGEKAGILVTLENLTDAPLTYLWSMEQPEPAWPAELKPDEPFTGRYEVEITDLAVMMAEDSGSYDFYTMVGYMTQDGSRVQNPDTTVSIPVTKAPEPEPEPEPEEEPILSLTGVLESPGPFKAGEKAGILVTLENLTDAPLTYLWSMEQPEPNWPAELKPDEPFTGRFEVEITYFLIMLAEDSSSYDFYTMVGYMTQDGSRVQNPDTTVPIPITKDTEPPEEPMTAELTLTCLPNPAPNAQEGDMVSGLFVLENTGDVPVRLEEMKLEPYPGSDSSAANDDLSEWEAYYGWVLFPNGSLSMTMSTAVLGADVSAGQVLRQMKALGTTAGEGYPFAEVESNPADLVISLERGEPRPEEETKEHEDALIKTRVGEPQNGTGYVLGETVHYQIRITNIYEADMYGLKVYDPIFGGDPEDQLIASLKLLPAGSEPWVISFDYVVTQEDLDRGDILYNQAHIEYTFGPQGEKQTDYTNRVEAPLSK